MLHDVFEGLVRWRLRFLALIAIAVTAWVLTANGLSWTSAVVIGATFLLLGLFWLVSTFWFWCFRNLIGPRET